jgi:ribonuclease HII
MKKISLKYPLYGFESHVGYGTKAHIEAIKKYGICPIHRRSFSPIKEMYCKK